MILKLIEKIEGEAYLKYELDKFQKISKVEVNFLTSRHIEEILKGKTPWDALVINPRVCGICGHSHLIATAKAIENSINFYDIAPNAKIIREITLSLEIIQNHLKWFYLTIAPLLGFKFDLQRVTLPSRITAKMIATLAGQYPHTSYAIPGGVTSAITSVDIFKLKQFNSKLIKLFKENIIDIEIDEFLKCNKIENMLKKDGDLPLVAKKILENSWENLGKSFDRFIVFGENSIFKSGKSISTRYTKSVNTKFVKEEEILGSKAKLVKYKDRFYEVGPLARAMINKTPLIKEAHRRFGDSIFSRILARVCEIPQLLNSIENLISKIDPASSFYHPLPRVPQNAFGVGVVEASRGSLIHKIKIEDFKIASYSIITPTQWNLGSSPNQDSIIQKALLGIFKDDPIELIFKSFDVCSVCTTH
jgi:hydrogenase large subunit